MKKEITRIFGIIFILLWGTVINVSAQKFGGGSGTKADPYLIMTAEHLFNVRTSPGAFFIIQNDIDLTDYQSGEGWLPISGFSGSMNGQGHTVGSLKINRPTANSQGLFAQIVPPGGRVESLNVSGNITGNSYVGGIAGQCSGVISKCGFTGTVNGNTESAGGIAGIVVTQGTNKATIIYCSNSGTVNGSAKIGGIAGFCSDAIISNSFNTGKVNQTANGMAGGIAGFNNNSNISACYNTGILSGKEDVGGIVGFSNPATCAITKCYNSGNITATANAGGIIGKNAESIVSDCVAMNAAISGNENCCRIVGKSLGSTTSYTNNYALSTMKVNDKPVTGNDAVPMNGLDKFLNDLRHQTTYETGLGWDFTTDWAFVTGYYPQLKQTSPIPEPLFDGGTGTNREPYGISTAAHLDNIRKASNSCFTLLNDIDLTEYQSGEGWIPIPRFTGHLNGSGFTIKNLKISRPSKDYQGLINILTNDLSGTLAKIENLSVSGEIVGKKYVGGLVAANYGGNIYKCSFSGSLKGTNEVGGIVGYMDTNSSIPESDRFSISECYNLAAITTEGTAGGIVGTSSYVKISNCYNSGPINAQYGYIGGIVGYAVGWSRGEGPNADLGGCLVTDCYNTGNIDGGFKIGGIAGLASIGKTVITKSYNSGNIVTANEDGKVGSVVGATTNATVSYCVAANTTLSGLKASRIVGENNEGKVENNYALSTMLVNGSAITEEGLETLNGLSKTIKELKLKSTYKEGLGWDFENIWVSVNGYLPVLKNVSEIPQEQFAGGDGSLEDPYIITAATHLDNVRNFLDAHFVMMADVDLIDYQSGEGWTPIATSNTTGFLGTFNGKGHKITNLKINRPDKDGQSLFGYAKESVVDSITVVNGSVVGKNKAALIISHGISIGMKDNKASGTVEGNDYIAGIIGYSEVSSITSCTNEANITALAHVAGIVGFNSGSITKCLNTGKITSTAPDNLSNKYVAGIVSLNYQGVIKESGNEGDIQSCTEFVGGVAGMNVEGLLEKCYNKGYVNGYVNMGGVCGLSDKGSSVVNSYNSGTVTGTINLGGVVGRGWQAKITSCYNEGEIKGLMTKPVTIGATGGVIGVNDQCATELSFNKGNVSGYDYVGGVAGVNTGFITKSYNTGNIKGTNEYTGGIAGSNPTSNEIENTVIQLCYNTGSVEGGLISTGGIAGRNGSQIINSYNVGTVKGGKNNGGIIGTNHTVGGGVVIVSFCLNLGDVMGEISYNGGIIGENGFSGQATFNVAANANVDGVESYRIVGVENANNMNYMDNNYALETMLINGVKVNGTNPMGLDGKGESLNALQSENTYLALGWDFDDYWFINDGLSFPILAWQPRLTTDIKEKISVKANDSYNFTLGLLKQEFEIDPMTDISWSYEEGKGITISSSNNLEFTVTGNNVGLTTTLKIKLNRGNTLSIPVEITDGTSIGENQLSEKASVYPNPVSSNGTLTVDISGLDEFIQSISLYDISSRLVQSLRTIDAERVELPISNVADGTYILSIRTSSGKTISKHIVVK